MTNKSELSVITKAKELCSYVMTVTEKSPKRFRFTLVSRMQNYALDVIENLYIANEIYVPAGRRDQAEKRQSYQQQAQTSLEKEKLQYERDSNALETKRQEKKELEAGQSAAQNESETAPADSGEGAGT